MKVEGVRTGSHCLGLGSRCKQRKVDIRVDVDLATLPGPPIFLDGPWVQVHGRFITGAGLLSGRIQGFQRQKDGKGCILPDSSGAGDEVGVPRNLFPRLGVG